jgi:hypothetical protein
LFYQNNSKHFPEPASAKLRLSVGLGPKKKPLSQATLPHCKISQNQNKQDVLRQESEGEVTQGETGVSTVVAESLPGPF